MAGKGVLLLVLVLLILLLLSGNDGRRTSLLISCCCCTTSSPLLTLLLEEEVESIRSRNERLFCWGVEVALLFISMLFVVAGEEESMTGVDETAAADTDRDRVGE